MIFDRLASQPVFLCWQRKVEEKTVGQHAGMGIMRIEVWKILFKIPWWVF